MYAAMGRERGFSVTAVPASDIPVAARLPASLCPGSFCGLLLLCQDNFTAFPHSGLPGLAVKTTFHL